MKKCYYTYLIYDDNKNPISIEPVDFNIMGYIKKACEAGKLPIKYTEIDINDAVHLFNALFYTNRELMDEIIKEYNKLHPFVPLDKEHMHYVKLVTKKYENIYGLPRTEDYDSQETNNSQIVKENIQVPIIYADDLKNSDERTTSQNKANHDMTLVHLLQPSPITFLSIIDGSESEIDFKYRRDPELKEFYLNLYKIFNDILQKRFQDVTKHDAFPGETMPKQSTNDIIFSEVFNKRCENGSIFRRMVLDEYLLYEKIHDIYKSFEREYIPGKTELHPLVFERLLTFSKSDLRNFKKISEKFPTERKEDASLTKEERVAIEKEKENEEEIIKAEREEQDFINRINSEFDTYYTASDLSDPSISSFIDEHSDDHKSRG